MTGTFKANNPINHFLLLMYGLVLHIPFLWHPVEPTTAATDGYFYRYLIHWIEPAGIAFPWLYSIIAFMLVYLQAIGINNLVNRQKMLPKPNYLPAMSYLLITATLPEWRVLSAPLIMATFLVWILSQLSRLYNHPNGRSIVFNIGMALGTATLFYFPGLAFILLVVVGLSITRPFKLTEWITAFLGMLAPAYFYAAWIFLTDQWQDFELPSVRFVSSGFHKTISTYLALGLILLALLVGSAFVQNSLNRLLVQSRKCWGLIYVYLLTGLLMPLLAGSFGPDNWMLVLAPVAAIMAAGLFYPDRKWYGWVMHWGLLALAVINGYFIR